MANGMRLSNFSEGTQHVDDKLCHNMLNKSEITKFSYCGYIFKSIIFLNKNLNLSTVCMPLYNNIIPGANSRTSYFPRYWNLLSIDVFSHKLNFFLNFIKQQPLRFSLIIWLYRSISEYTRIFLPFICRSYFSNYTLNSS